MVEGVVEDERSSLSKTLESPVARARVRRSSAVMRWETIRTAR
jgi:hypothetical protein